jgi:hypothetical protein
MWSEWNYLEGERVKKLPGESERESDHGSDADEE